LQRAAAKRPIRVGLIGAGKFGSMYLAQVPRTPGVHLAAIADLSPEAARANLARVGWAPEQARPPASTRPCKAADLAHRGLAGRGAPPGHRRGRRMHRPPDRGGRHCLEAFAHGKHVVNVTVEADAFCGPLLARRAARPAWSIRWPSATSRR
jgi:predicted homoserine dehydrogenase-like protein